jgi:hypothetical protein
MSKHAAVAGASRGYEPRPADLPSVVEGQVAELCRDLAIEARRVQTLQGQADDLRKTIRQWIVKCEDSNGDIS